MEAHYYEQRNDTSGKCNNYQAKPPWSVTCMCCAYDMEVWEEDEFNEFDDLPLMVEVVRRKHIQWISYFLARLQRKFYFPDAAISLLLLFFATLFRVLSKIAPPSTIRKKNQMIASNETFVEYVACEKCYTVKSNQSVLK